MTEQRLVLADRADSEPIAASVVAHVASDRIEVEVPRGVRVVRVFWIPIGHAKRTRPIVAVVACIVELVVPTVARSGQEKTVAVGGGE